MPSHDIIISAAFVQVLVYSLLALLAIYLLVKLIPAIMWRLATSHAKKCSLDRIRRIELSMMGEDPIQESVSAIRGIHTYKLFILYLRDGQTGRAERMLQTAMMESQSLFVFRQAISYYQATGNLDQVRKIYETVLQRKKKSIGIRKQYAAFLISIEDYQEALHHYHVCLYKHSRSSLYRNQIGYCYMQLGDSERALPYFKKILAFDESDSAPFYNAAECYIRMQDYDNAFKLLSRVPEKMRDCGHYCFLVKLHVASGDFESAKDSLIHAIRLMPGDIDIMLSVISLLFSDYAAKSKYDDMLSLADTLKNEWDSIYDWDEDEEDEDATRLRYLLDFWWSFGAVYADDPSGLPQVGQILDRLLTEQPEDHELLHLYAIYCVKSGRYTEAVDYSRRAISFHKREPFYFATLSNCLAEIYHFSESLYALEDGLFYNPDELRLYLDLGAKLAHWRSFTDAGRILKRLEETTSEQADVLESLTSFWLGQSDWRQAEQYFYRLNEADAENSSFTELQSEIDKLKTPPRARIAGFIQGSYYYLTDSGALAIQTFSAVDGDPSIHDVKALFEAVIQPQDKYSFMLIDEEYIDYQAMSANQYVWSEHIEHDIIRIRIEQFADNTYAHFGDALSAISDAPSKRLVLDLRANTGGNLDSAMKIADMLTPPCKLVTLHNRDGKALTEFESTAHWISFKQIYVLIDGETASASETLALILKKRLPNVLILGKRSFGKDVGMSVLQLNELSCAVVLCSNTLSIDGIKILNDSVTPDIPLEDECDWIEYLKKIDG